MSRKVYNPVVVMGGCMTSKIVTPTRQQKQQQQEITNINTMKDKEKSIYVKESIKPIVPYARRKHIWWLDLDAKQTLYIEDLNTINQMKLIQQQIINTHALLTQPPQGTLLEADDALETPTLVNIIESPSLKHLSPEATFILFSILCIRLHTLSHSHFNALLTNIVSPYTLDSTIPPEIAQYALKIYNKMKTNGHTPDHTTFTCLYRAFKYSTPHLAAIHKSAMEHIKRSTPTNTKQTYQTLPKLTSLQTTQTLSDTAFRTYLAALSLSKSKIDISPLWYDMKTAKVHPSLLTCIGFLELIKKSKDERLLMEVHKYMKTNYLNGWDAYVYGRVMDAYCYFEKWLACQHLFQDMRAANIYPTT